MASLKVIRKRISSVKNTQKITKAMKMVAAAKLRRAQDQIQAFRPYSQGLHQVVFDLIEHLDTSILDGSSEEQKTSGKDPQVSLLNKLRWFFKQTDENRVRILMLTSDRGLAGAFNGNIFRRMEQFLVEKSGCTIEVEVIGRKGRDYTQRRTREIRSSLQGRNLWTQATLTKEYLGLDARSASRYAKEIAASLKEARESGIDAVYVLYNQFHSAARQSVVLKRLLPFSPKTESESTEKIASLRLVDFVYEPSKEEVFTHLLPLYFETEIHKILLESIASEFGARMSAMDNASRNAKEMISGLTLQMNRVRQAAITKELMEIIGGAEALK